MGQPQQKNHYTEEEMRSEIITTVEQMDKSFLRVVHSIMRTYAEENMLQESDIVDYDENGVPISRGEFLKEADSIREDVKKGNFVTLEELDKKHEAWK